MRIMLQCYLSKKINLKYAKRFIKRRNMREERKCSIEEMGASYHSSSSEEVMAVNAAERNRREERGLAEQPGQGEGGEATRPADCLLCHPRLSDSSRHASLCSIQLPRHTHTHTHTELLFLNLFSIATSAYSPNKCFVWMETTFSRCC